MQSDKYEPGSTDSWETRMAHARPVWIPLLPAAIVAVGNPGELPEQLLELQSAIGRLIYLATVAGRLRPKLRFSALPSLRLRFRLLAQECIPENPKR